MTDILQRLARLPEGRRAEFLAKLRAEAKTAPGGPVPRAADAPTPVSFNQEPLWAYAQLAPDAPTYNMPFADRLRGPLDVDALRGALAAVVARHESLRSELREEDGVPLLRVLADVPVELPVVVIDGADEAERLARVLTAVTADARAGFALDRAPLWRARLYRLGPEDHVLLFLVHHAVFDGWSQSVFAADLAEFYRAAATGTAAAPQELAIQYPDFAIWQRETLSEQRMDELGRWWRTRLSDAPVLDFPTDRPRPRQVTFAGTVAAWPMPAGLFAASEALARQTGQTPFVVQTAAFLALLRRYTGQDDLVIGSPTANRGRSELETVIGFFINQLVLRVDLSGDPTFGEVLDRVREVVQAAATHDIPFGKLVDAVRPPRDRSRQPLFQIAFALQETGSQLALEGLAGEELEVATGTSRFDMAWNVTRDGGEGRIVVEYNTDLYDAETVDQFARLYGRILALACAEPERRLSELEADLMDDAERERLLRFADAPTRAVRQTTIVEQFERRAAAYPEAVALVTRGESTSYDELNRRANQIARLLAEHGAGRGSIVALALPRTADMVASVLGVLKAGAAYLPLDITHPAARVHGILADAEAVAVLTDSANSALVASGPAPVFALDSLAAELVGRPDTNPGVVAGPDDVAYVIYTSGSTGKPKGVLVEHRSVVNFVDNVTELFELTDQDRILGFASYTFDVSVFETFSALLNGARLYVAADDERLSPERLQDLLAEAEITVTDLPPAVMALLDPAAAKALRIVFVGGEAFSADLVNRWNPGRRLFNGYGPTECTVTMIVEECPGVWDSTPPIGLPMVNHVAHVLDSALRPVPSGVPGELVIGGEGLARGYLNAPELTDQKFVADPFGTAPGARLYRTGDLVKRRADGKLVFLGRIDRQVKIRGLRIELGEVESALAAFPGFGEVAVEPWTDDAGVAHLVGYAACAGEQPSTAALREFLGARLPGYMIPSHFVLLAELPLTASGKIDRKSLPAPEAAGGTGAVLAPRTETERVLVEEIVAPLLGVERVGVEDDFFQSGGNSLQAAQLISAINRRFGVEVGLADFFLSPTPAHLASIVDGGQSAAMSDDELFNLLESLTDDEVGARLEEPGDGA